jgi:Zn finger protein HypA/HybF involved in hydrogenase expression
MIIERQAQDLEEGVTEVAHKIEIFCGNCGRDVDEQELAAQKCGDCGSDLTQATQNISIAVTSIPLFGVTFG